MLISSPYSLSLKYRCIFLLFLSFTNVAIADKTHNWQGFYLGIYAGGGVANHRLSTDTGNITSSSYFESDTDLDDANNAGSSKNNPATLIAGMQAGHDWIVNQMMYGMVLDYTSFSLRYPYPGASDQYSISTSLNTNWMFTLRGRLGYSTTLRWPALLYLTGGVALTQIKISNDFSDDSSKAGEGGNSLSTKQLGWVAGTGIEFGVYDHTALTLEYLYVQLPPVTTSGYIFNTQGGFGMPPQSLNSPFSTTGHWHVNLLKIGLKYQF